MAFECFSIPPKDSLDGTFYFIHNSSFERNLSISCVLLCHFFKRQLIQIFKECISLLWASDRFIHNFGAAFLRGYTQYRPESIIPRDNKQENGGEGNNLIWQSSKPSISAACFVFACNYIPEWVMRVEWREAF